MSNRKKHFEYGETASVKSKQTVFDSLEFMEKIGREMMLDLQHQSVAQVESQREFRTSGLPFCPILDFLKDPQFEDYKKSHYTSTGTAIHTTKQSWLSMSPYSSKILWGNWKCTGCGAIKTHQMKPTKLCECSYTRSTTEFHRRWPKHWTYDEVEYNYNGLTGHIDLIVMPRPDFAFVGDFKTTDIKKKTRSIGWTQDKISSPTYVAQVRTYATILDLLFKLPIKGWMLINADRGSPVTSYQDFHIQVGDWNKKKSLKWDGYLQEQIANNKRLLRLESAVEAQDTQLSSKRLKSIVINRPCIDERSYNNYMQYKFYKGKCEHCQVCTEGSDKAVYKTIMNKLAEKE